MDGHLGARIIVEDKRELYAAFDGAVYVLEGDPWVMGMGKERTSGIGASGREAS